jgi:8-oxo-dGTP pyrophosphatase MutT (NUDIX family)
MPNLGLSSFWQRITGAAEDNETLIQAAKRELLEETNITTDKLEPVNYSYRIPIQAE